MKFITKLIQRLETSGSALCIGLDSRFDRIPEFITKTHNVTDSIFEFNRSIIERTYHLTAAYKMNLAFYAGFGSEGLAGLLRTTNYLKTIYPTIPLLADCKRSEMGESVKMVKNEIFSHFGFDAVMVTPWFGFDTVRDYLDDERCGVIVYAHDSNPSAVEFQDLMVKVPDSDRVVPLYEYVTERITSTWNTNGNIIIEAGLTYPGPLRRIRGIVGEEMPLLIAGLGAQGGKVEDLKGLFGTNRARVLVNVSRGIIFAGEGRVSYFDGVKDAAQHYFELINATRDQA